MFHVLIRKNHSSDISPASPKIAANARNARQTIIANVTAAAWSCVRVASTRPITTKAEERRASHRRCFNKITSKLLRQAWLKSRRKKALFVGPIAFKKTPKATENMSRARFVLRHVLWSCVCLNCILTTLILFTEFMPMSMSTDHEITGIMKR